jgi:serine/threonine protein kinase
MGLVFVAETIPERNILAVKILKPEFQGDPDVVARFLDEARAAERFVHPNIVRIFGHGVSGDGTPYITMELLEGVPFNKYTKKGERTPIAQALPIMQGILSGLTAAHAAGVVHRDLKPANIFLSRNPQGVFEVKLLDFGIAKVMDAAGGMGSKTRTGMFLGTPAYMSPEQIKSPKNVDARTDLWAAGVMFYRMLTGEPPFSGQYEVDRLSAILTETQEPIERIDPALAPLSEFMTRALQKDRANRFQSAAEMAQALGQAAAGGLGSNAPPVHAAEIDDAAGVPKKRSSGPSWAVAVILFLVAFAAGVGSGFALAKHR